MRNLQVARVAAAILLGCCSIAHSQTLTAAHAKAHEGEKATVCGQVVSEKTATSSRGEPPRTIHSSI